jgi:hypothetical protein
VRLSCDKFNEKLHLQFFKFLFCMYLFTQIVGTSKKFQKKKKLSERDGSDGEESNSNENDINKIQSFTPSTPPPYKIAKRRKGVPHRAPIGGGLIY